MFKKKITSGNIPHALAALKKSSYEHPLFPIVIPKGGGAQKCLKCNPANC